MTSAFRNRDEVAIVGFAQSQIVVHADRSLGALTVDTVRDAIADASLSVDQIDGFVASTLFPAGGDHASRDGVTSVSANWLVSRLGVEPSYVAGFQGMGQIPGAVAMAVNAVATGAANYVVMHRSLHNPIGRYHENSMREARGDQQWTAPQGYFGPLAMIALTYNEYLQRYGASADTLAKVVAEARKHGARIPWSYWQGSPLTEAEYLKSPMINDPIRRLDCDRPVDGAAAFVFTTAERARDLPHRPVYVRGYASAVPLRHRLPMHWPLDDVMEAGVGLAARLWAHAGISPEEVDLPQLYDGFSPLIYLWLEALGFCPVGQAHEFVHAGGLDSDAHGGMPALSGGGALGNGRMHGIPQMLECYLQLAGRAGERQRAKATLAIACHSSPHLGGAVVYRG